MIYKPENGCMWDPSVLYHDGYYYMVSMYKQDADKKDNFMWMAKSEDGVHWESIGPVLEDTCGVCKMYIYEADDKVVINFGSFSDPGRCNNDTLRFYVSQDMVNWRFVGENHPDAKWYKTTGRWDHMYVYKENNVYYGYPVATPLPELCSAWGLCKSSDGYNWICCPPPVIEWGDIPCIDCLEGGEEEAQLGRKSDMSGGAGVEEVLVGIVAQLERRCLHRADGADKILVDVAGGVRLQLVILAAVRNIIGVGGEENEAVRLAHIERFNNFAAERFAGVHILALRLAQGLEQTVLVAVRDLRGGEFDVNEVAPQRAGERLFEQPQIHLLLLLPHEAEGGVDPRDDLAVGVDIAAEDAAEVIFIEPETPADLVEFFLVHLLLPSLTEYHGEKLYHSVPRAARGTTSIHTEKKNG